MSLNDYLEKVLSIHFYLEVLSTFYKNYQKFTKAYLRKKILIFLGF